MCNCVWFMLHCHHLLISRPKMQNIIARMSFTMSPGETIWKAGKTWRAFSVCNMSAVGSLTGTLEPGTFPFGQAGWPVNHRDLFLPASLCHWVTSMQSIQQVFILFVGCWGVYSIYIFTHTCAPPKIKLLFYDVIAYWKSLLRNYVL